MDQGYVVNLNLWDGSYDEYIGRPSKWENRYTHLPVRSVPGQHLIRVPTREDAVAFFEADLRKKLHQDDNLKKELMKLRGKTLGCFCKPLACHGDVLIKLIEELSTESDNKNGQ